MAWHHITHPLRAGNLAADAIRGVASFASGARSRHLIGAFGPIGEGGGGGGLDSGSTPRSRSDRGRRLVARHDENPEVKNDGVELQYGGARQSRKMPFPSSLTLEMFCLNDSPFRALAALSSTYQSLVVEVLKLGRVGGERSRSVEIRHACKGCEEIDGGVWL
jgi:hypothetical protein